MIADMVRKLFEKGVDQEAILIAIEAAEQALMSALSADVRGHSADVQAEERRRRDRERKRMKREIPQISADVRRIPRNSENASLSKKDNINNLSLEREARKKSVRGHRLPENWKPEDADWQESGQLLGFDRTKAELAKFTDHWKQQPGAKGVKLDWSATWRNWIRRAAEYGAQRNGHSSLNGQRKSASSDFFAGIASVAADLNGHDPASGPASEEIPLGRFNIDG